MAVTNPTELSERMAQHRIWQHLSNGSRDDLLNQARMEQFQAGSLLLAAGTLSTQLGWVLAGRVRLEDPDLALAVELGPDELFGLGATAQTHLSSWQASASTDCQVLWLTAQTVIELCSTQPSLRYFLPSYASSPTMTVPKQSPAGLMSTPVRALLRRPAVTASPDLSIAAAAAEMATQQVSSILLLHQGQLQGLVTDRDLRSRVLAKKLDSAQAVASIASTVLVSIQADSTVFEALLAMARHRIHHLPVLDGTALLGMLTHTDLLTQQTSSAVFMARDIDKQDTLEGLVAISERTKLLQQQLAGAQVSAYSTGHMVTAITDALTVRLINMAHTSLGPAPVPYLWVAAGSQARCEQTAKSDQDNCLILDNAYEPSVHGDYFKAFSKYVCDGLAACGYIHCPGEMMAMTDTWRQPQAVWVRYFEGWIHQPKPKALMLTCVFFDLRAIHGQAALLEQLRTEVLTHTRGNTLFLGHMVGNALKNRPPLGLFGRITLSQDTEHPDTLNLKHNGIVPIVDLARIYALAVGVSASNTHDRLIQSAHGGEVSTQSAHDLRDALAFIGKLRLAHQARQIQQGLAPDNHLALTDLSHFERDQLKQAFGVVQTLQDVLHKRYGGGGF